MLAIGVNLPCRNETTAMKSNGRQTRAELNPDQAEPPASRSVALGK